MNETEQNPIEEITHNKTEGGDRIIIKKNPSTSTLTIEDIVNLFKIIFFSSLSIGLIIVTIYFFSIDFSPITNIYSAISLLVVISQIGFSLFAILAATIILGPLLWCELLKTTSTCEFIVGQDKAPSVIKSYKTGYINLELESRKQILITYLSTTGIIFGLLILLCLFEYNFFSSVLITFLILGKIGFWWAFSNFKIETKNKFFKFIKVSTPLIKIELVSFLPAILLFVAASLLSELIDVQEHLKFITICLYLLFSTMLFVVPVYENWKLLNSAIIVAAIFLFFIIIISDGVSTFSRKIIHLTKFGDIRNATISVNRAGCEILQSNFLLNCKADRKIFKVANVDILWRGGENYIQGSTNQKKSIENLKNKFILPFEYIKGIEIPIISNKTTQKTNHG